MCRNLHDLQEVSCDNKIYLIFIICSSTMICYFSGKMSNIIEGEAPESDDEDMFLPSIQQSHNIVSILFTNIYIHRNNDWDRISNTPNLKP